GTPGPGGGGWRACWRIGGSGGGSGGPGGTACGVNSRWGAPRGGPRRWTARPWSAGAVEPDAPPRPQLSAVRRRHRPHDGRGRAPLSGARPAGLDGNLAGERRQRPARPPDRRPRGGGGEAAAHSERAVPLDAARRRPGTRDGPGIRLVRRDQARGVRGGLAARAPRSPVRRAGARGGLPAAPGEGATLALQALDGEADPGAL